MFYILYWAIQKEPSINPLPLSRYLGKGTKKLLASLKIEQHNLEMVNIHYRKHEIPKKTGGKRILNIPSRSLKKIQKKILLNLLYKDNMEQMYEDFKTVINLTKPTNSKHTKKLIETIENRGSISKIDLFKHYCGWGRGIKWTSYRRALMNHPNIYDVIESEPTYKWVE